MSKTIMTKKIEQKLFRLLEKRGEYPCLEVTAGIGWSKDGRVDVMSCDTKSNIRCFEIKVSASDFHSKAKKTFVGDYNYYAMPLELYEKVKDDIPSGIGVYLYIEETNELVNEVKAKKYNVSMEEKNELLLSMVRSMTRDVGKLTKIQDDSEYKKLQDKHRELEKERDKLYKRCADLQNTLFYLLGGKWEEILDNAKSLYLRSNHTMRFMLQQKEYDQIDTLPDDVKMYDALEIGILEYFKNQKTMKKVPTWLSTLYTNTPKKILKQVLLLLMLERDEESFKYLLSKETREKIKEVNENFL